MSYSFGQPDVAARLAGLPPPDGEVNARQPGAILHALQILECVAHHGPGTTAREISTCLKVSRATTYRLVRLLADDEYLVRMPDLRGFALGRRVAELAAPATPTPPLSRAARAVLTGLRDQVRAGVHLVHYAGAGIVITDEDGDIPLTDPHRLLTDPGSTAAGRLAAAWTEAQRTGNRPPTHELQVRHVSAYRGCLALPVQDDAGHLVAALLVEAPAAPRASRGAGVDPARRSVRAHDAAHLSISRARSRLVAICPACEWAPQIWWSGLVASLFLLPAGADAVVLDARPSYGKVHST